jgi:hypothetical protein
MGRFFFVDVTTSRPQGHELGCSPAGHKRTNCPSQHLLTIGIEGSREDVISPAAFDQIPVGSEQLRIVRFWIEPSMRAVLLFPSRRLRLRLTIC